ncbi:endolytic transglycosylase MltG [Dethiothermospora halolimnae]|uniref:endolytic transglycosylase MltG n=1 Tax=Dethiothermospora halolimnae TaxID=3114390 RepID=UPI003CCBA253
MGIFKDTGWKKVLAIIMSIVIVLSLTLFYYVRAQISPVASGDEAEDITIDIPSGSSTNNIAKLLKDNNIIKNKYMFTLIVKAQKKDGKLKAGTYTLNNGMEIKDIIDELSKGGKSDNTVRFTIPEGYELGQIAELLNKKGIVDKDKFLKLSKDISNFTNNHPVLKELSTGMTLEGYLYPDTYEVYKDASEEEIISKMIERFEELYTKHIKSKATKMNMDLNRVTTLASIIEREAMLDEERPLVSAVFHNRLEMDKPLESCATVQYILGERKEVLSIADTNIESPYNTYRNPGLPPAPIASPGIESMKAAVNPADTDYLFFVANGDGSHTFTKTYKEHLKAKNKNQN